MSEKRIILGAGITGLTAGMKTGFPIYEALGHPGGICASYFIAPGSKAVKIARTKDDDSYEFSIGGGHWIFGCDDEVARLINRFSPVKAVARKSAVYFPRRKLYAEYPIQNNVKRLGRGVEERVARELPKDPSAISARTMKDWMLKRFGPTLFGLFFGPFHERYTAGLFARIAPQDLYKTPSDVRRPKPESGPKAAEKGVGYNAAFVYPASGMNSLIYGLARSCDVRYNKRVVKIDIKKRAVFFSDGTSVGYARVISTLPLDKMLELTGLGKRAGRKDPHTSVLVLNIGAVRGSACPDDHWLYLPKSSSGFFRAGFYSNVDNSFLPVSPRVNSRRVSIYVERAFMPEKNPSGAVIKKYSEFVARELQGWKFIKKIEVIDPNWVDVAYTWSWPDSGWRERAIKVLDGESIRQTGRYGLWRFQGIADSIKQGLGV